MLYVKTMKYMDEKFDVIGEVMMAMDDSHRGERMSEMERTADTTYGVPMEQ